MTYKAKNVDTDKVLKAIDEDVVFFLKERERTIYGVEQYYKGLLDGLNRAKGYFECSNYEKDGE